MGLTGRTDSVSRSGPPSSVVVHSRSRGFYVGVPPAWRWRGCVHRPGSPGAVGVGGPLLVDVCVAGQGVETSGRAALTVPGRSGGQRRSRTVQSRAVLHLRELGVAHRRHRSAGTPCGWNPAGTVVWWLACVTQHHVLQVHPCCGRCPRVLPGYGCDSPSCRWAPPYPSVDTVGCLHHPVAVSPTSHPLRPAAHPHRPSAAPSGTTVDRSCPHCCLHAPYPSATRVLGTSSAAAPGPLLSGAFVVLMLSPDP